MTEDEARQKWCPFVRHFNALYQPCGNSLVSMLSQMGDRNVEPFHCIASGCMMWEFDLPDAHPDASNRTPTGYCGLAGRAS